ncbi:hypothetical protein GIB67_036474 [Kingdonia uniflora]|uniref:Uncharacterized protein n=1 Tax=Kingdonia uniflora TaxID=39325 RepID=A0A7J7P7T9_9MAGN|nr:hypothetical protein GIB67_036474 [Kingdonia uniflora]
MGFRSGIESRKEDNSLKLLGQCSCFKSTGEIDLDNDNLSKAACCEGSSDNYLYYPRMAVDCLDWFKFLRTLNLFDILNSNKLVLSKPILDYLNERYGVQVVNVEEEVVVEDLDNFEEVEDSDFDSYEEEALSDGEEVGDESVMDSDTSEESCIKEKK